MTPEQFKEIRLKKGLSQARLSVILKGDGYPASHGRISNWELGYAKIPQDIAKRMGLPTLADVQEVVGGN